MGEAVYDLREVYTQRMAKAYGQAFDFEIHFSMDDGGLSDIAAQIKEATGSKLRLTDKRSWHGKWYAQNYDYYRQLVWNKIIAPREEAV